MAIYQGLAFFGVLITALSQIFLKLGARRTIQRSIFGSFLNFWTIIGYLMLVSVTIINLIAYKVLPLKMMVFFLPMNYIFVVFLSRIILKEQIKKKTIIGLSIILCGVCLYNI